MTNPTPHGQVPEALRLAEEISNLVCSSEAAAKTIAAAADELCRLHVENASLRAALAASPTPPAEQPATTKADATTGAALGVEPGAVYAELPAPTASIGTDDAWHEAAMRDFADRTHALRMQAAPKAAPGVPIEIERAIRAAGLTLVKTTNGYSLLKLGKIEAQVEQPSCLQVKRDEWDALPLGAQRLLIAATKAAPQQEAQEPVVAAVFDEQLGRPVLVEGAPLLRHGQELYTAPQPAPAPLSADVVKDAARYRWLREGNDAKHGAAWHVAVNLYGCEWDAAIDAAIAAQGGKT